MDNKFETAKASFREVLQKCIDMEWITVPEHVSLDGIASRFANKLSEMDRGQEIREMIGKLIWLKHFHPEEFNGISNLFKDEKA